MALGRGCPRPKAPVNSMIVLLRAIHPRIDADPAAQGLPSQTLQIHTPIDRYPLAGATTVATLYSDATTPTTFPAVVTASAGAGRTLTRISRLGRA